MLPLTQLGLFNCANECGLHVVLGVHPNGVVCAAYPAGGERSYTTVAFILALGKFTESPFRAMDEYDVFMDAVNRRIATQTLLAFALEEVELQFVLLTPQVCVCGSLLGVTACIARCNLLHIPEVECLLV